MNSTLSGYEESRLRGRFSFRSPAANRCDIDARLPHLMVGHFCEIDFARLAGCGVHYYCLDVDNTLLPQTAEALDPAVVSHLQEARRQGWIRKLCIISNVIWSRGQRRIRLDRLARELEIDLVYGASFWTRKPTPTPYLWALSAMGSAPAQTAMIGDQIFTDVLGGNQMGLYTVLVRPMSGDHWSTSLIGRRWREALLMRQYMIRR